MCGTGDVSRSTHRRRDFISQSGPFSDFVSRHCSFHGMMFIIVARIAGLGLFLLILMLVPLLSVLCAYSPPYSATHQTSNQTMKTVKRRCHQAASRAQPVRACQLAVFSGRLPSMEAEIDCKLQSNSS